MAKGVFKPKRTKMGKSGWHISRVDGRTKHGKEINQRVREMKAGKFKTKKFEL